MASSGGGCDFWALHRCRGTPWSAPTNQPPAASDGVREAAVRESLGGGRPGRQEQGNSKTSRPNQPVVRQAQFPPDPPTYPVFTLWERQQYGVTCWDEMQAFPISWPGWQMLKNLCYFCCLVAKSSLTLCHPMDCSPPGFSVHGNLQAKILEWVAISFSRGSSQPRNRTWVSCIADEFFIERVTREALKYMLFYVELFEAKVLLSCCLSKSGQRNLSPHQFNLMLCNFIIHISCFVLCRDND